MIYENIVHRVQNEYEELRNQNLLNYEVKVQQISEKYPELGILISKRHQALLSGIRSSITPNKQTNINENLPNLLKSYTEQIKKELIKNNLDENTLEPQYHCKICNDEGYLYSPHSTMCSCFKEKLHKYMLESIGLGNNKETFENFNPDLFSNDIVSKSTVTITQKQLAIHRKNICEAYADNFPNTEQRDLLLYGNSGLGKTYLLHAIAHRVIERGILPYYTTAYAFFSLARKAYMENNDKYLAPLFETDLLLLDDLGTEPLMQNITIPQLFTLINERTLSNKHTIISTNLNFNEFKERYTERISSRMLDKSTVQKLLFLGEDIRKNIQATKEITQ